MSIQRARETWTTTPALALLLCVVSAGTLSCSSVAKDPPTTEPIEILVTGERGLPLPGAELYHDSDPLPPTGPDGISRLQVSGKEGVGFEVDLKCPQNYRAITPSIVVTKVLLAATDHAPQYAMSCRRLSHTLVVAVRVNEILDIAKKKMAPLAGLPLIYLGQEIAYTDASGAVTLYTDLQDGQHFDITVGTPGKASSTLHPQNPISSFVGHGKDEVVLLDQTFTRDRPPPKRGGPARPSGPRQIR